MGCTYSDCVEGWQINTDLWKLQRQIYIKQCVEEETYPLPNTEDVFATLAGGKLFTKLDLSHAYPQLELDKDSEKYLTANTYHRL